MPVSSNIHTTTHLPNISDYKAHFYIHNNNESLPFSCVEYASHNISSKWHKDPETFMFHQCRKEIIEKHY